MNVAKSIGGGMRFMREVRAEGQRVSWPKLADTRLMTLMVFILVVIIGLYLMAVDALVSSSMNWLLGV